MDNKDLSTLLNDSEEFTKWLTDKKIDVLTFFANDRIQGVTLFKDKLEEYYCIFLREKKIKKLKNRK